jgi:hypothetical protein
MLGFSAAGGVAAEPATGAGAQAERPVVHLCERGNYAERMLKREHGAAPFATAAEVLKVANGSAGSWSSPRCMTGLEYARLDAALRRAGEEKARSRATSVLARR